MALLGERTVHGLEVPHGRLCSPREDIAFREALEELVASDFDAVPECLVAEEHGERNDVYPEGLRQLRRDV